MAFVNAYLTEEEKVKFNEAKIPDPRWNLPKRYLDPRRWTVDKERGIALINCGVADRENYEIETFAFVNTYIEKKELLSFEMKRYYLEKQKEEKLKMKYGVESIINWKVFNVNSSGDLKITSSEEFFNLLSEALTEYGITGRPGPVLSIKVFVKLDM